jgi:hypothetical protein
MTNKRGALSKIECGFIRDNVTHLSIEEICKELKRTKKTVEKFIKGEGLIHEDDSIRKSDRVRLLNILYSRPYWPEYQKQLTDNEIHFFKETWIEKMKQFRENILYTEEETMADGIRISILINRSMSERKIHEEDKESLVRMITEEKLKEEEDLDRELLANLENQLAFARSSITNYSREYKDLREQLNKIDKSLKATREERIERIESSKSTWVALLKSLENEEERESESRKAELLRMASVKAKERLSEYHEFEDGEVDRPFLLPETVTEDDLE